MDSLWQYKGVDWAGAVLAVIALYYLGKHKKRGFVFGFFGNVVWIVFGVMASSVASIVANVVYIAFNIHAWRNWKEEQQG